MWELTHFTYEKMAKTHIKGGKGGFEEIEGIVENQEIISIQKIKF